MCGIAGIYSPQQLLYRKDIIHQMIDAIQHRGPDDAGYTLFNLNDNSAQDYSSVLSSDAAKASFPDIHTEVPFPFHLAFGQNRFSIIDLSFNGHQPFWDSTHQYCILFNGEIYNYIEIREQLTQQGISFRTQSDTEVILEGYKVWGYDIFHYLNGPWAISIVDKVNQRLILCRDRIGKNPLYFTLQNNQLIWCSEIRGIFSVIPSDHFLVNERAIYDFTLFSIRDAENQTFWKDIHSIEQATVYELDLHQRDLKFKTHRFWNIPRQRLRKKDISFQEAKHRLFDLLCDAIRIRLRADVPIAYTLSGGLDSSTLIALGTRFLHNPIHAYTVRFTEADEVSYAQAVVRSYPDKISHHILTPQKEDFWLQANEFIRIEEEPFHSPNLLTDYNIQQRLRQDGFKVMINGAAGDEVLAGYEEYFRPFLKQQFRDLKFLSLLKNILFYSHFSPFQREKLRILLQLGQRYRYPKHHAAETYYTGADFGYAPYLPADIYSLLIQNMSNTKMNYWMRSSNKTYFRIPIEIRCPFLDYRIVDLAFSVPVEYLIHHGWHKYLLREAVRDLLPDAVVWRKQKMGFPFPYKEWLEYSKPIIYHNLQKMDCPYINIRLYLEHFDHLKIKDPHLCWRVLSVLLWWKRVILDLPINNP